MAESLVVMVPGTELDLLTCPGWRRQLISAVERDGCRILIIDLSRVTFFGAAGLSVLSHVRAHAGQHDVELRVIVCSRPVWRPLQVTGMAGEFAIYRSRADALTEPQGAEAARRWPVTKPRRPQRVWDSVAAYAEGRGVPVAVDVVCATAVARLPVTGAAVSVQSALTVSEVVCATSPLSRDLEDLQLTLGEGPSLEVLGGSRALLLRDLESADPQRRWPIFAGQAVEAGARAFFALPMRIGAVRVGVLALTAQRPGPLSAEELAEAGVFAELALELLLDVHAGITRRNGELPVDGLTGRPELHQATGMISVQLGVGMTEAMVRLRARAFADGRPLHELAADVVTRRLRFEIEDLA